jgi:hypothetical protein
VNFLAPEVGPWRGAGRVSLPARECPPKFCQPRERIARFFIMEI